MLVNFDPPEDLFTRWEIFLFSPPGFVLPVVSVRVINFLVPRIALSLGGIESHVTPASVCFMGKNENDIMPTCNW